MFSLTLHVFGLLLMTGAHADANRTDTANATRLWPTARAEERPAAAILPNCAPHAVDENLVPDVYLYATLTREWARVSGSPAGEWREPSLGAVLDRTGSTIAFSSQHPVDIDDDHHDFDLHLRPLDCRARRG
jgi:hypothetical protein